MTKLENYRAYGLVTLSNDYAPYETAACVFPSKEFPQEFSGEFCMNSRDTTLENANFPME